MLLAGLESPVHRSKQRVCWLRRVLHPPWSSVLSSSKLRLAPRFALITWGDPTPIGRWIAGGGSATRWFAIATRWLEAGVVIAMKWQAGNGLDEVANVSHVQLAVMK